MTPDSAAASSATSACSADPTANVSPCRFVTLAANNNLLDECLDVHVDLWNGWRISYKRTDFAKADRMCAYLSSCARIPDVTEVASKLPDACRFRPADWHTQRAERDRQRRMAKYKARAATMKAAGEPTLPPPEVMGFGEYLEAAVPLHERINAQVPKIN